MFRSKLTYESHFKIAKSIKHKAVVVKLPCSFAIKSGKTKKKKRGGISLQSFKRGTLPFSSEDCNIQTVITGFRGGVVLGAAAHRESSKSSWRCHRRRCCYCCVA